MSSSTTAVERLDRLRASYRAAFRKWISARSVLDAGPLGTDAVSKAQAQEGAAALAYRNARDQLTDAMQGWGDRGRIDAEKASRPAPIQKSPPSLGKGNERREWLRDFILALILVTLTVAGSTLLVTEFSPK